MSPHPSLLVFEPHAGGHRGQYIHHVLAEAARMDYKGRIDLLLPYSFLERHPELASAIPGWEKLRLHTHFFSLGEGRNTPKSAIQRDIRLGQALASFAETLRPERILLMHFDIMQLSLGQGLRFEWPTKIAGLYFRPSFHYGELNGQPSPTLNERVRRLRKRIMLKRALNNPHMSALLSLDPYALDPIQSLAPRVKVLPLPDGVGGVTDGTSSDDIRARWQVEQGRQVAILFGSLTARKGTFATLNALRHLDAGLQTCLCMVFAGRIHPPEKEQFMESVEALRADTHVQLIVEPGHHNERTIQPMLKAADLVLVPYQHHTGSSNVLVRAALAGRPVLGDNYGLVGHHIQANKLGLTVDATNPEALAKGIERCLLEQSNTFFDADQALHFGQSNSAEGCGRTIFEALQ